MAPLNYKPVKATPAQELDPGGTWEHFPPNLCGAGRVDRVTLDPLAFHTLRENTSKLQPPCIEYFFEKFP
jgi:hypothetical protein